MKILKPFRLSVLTRPYRWRGANHLGIAVLACADLGETPRLRPEQELWQLGADALDPGSVLDMGMPKAEPEFLASGHAYTRHQDCKTMCAVSLRVGEVERQLAVFGDRFWLDGRATEPAPFERMPLDWRHAFGGPGIAENPLGKGGAEELVNGVLTRRLPNVESVSQRLAHPGQRPTPASFSAYLPDWPQRMAWIGKQYDAAWLNSGFPGFADDFDWRFFNMASPGQRWTGAGHTALRGGAPYEIRNMHPTRPVLRGRLPAWQALCHLSQAAQPEALRRVDLALSTAWFFPDRERVVLVWHGATRVAEDDAADVHHIMPALEHAHEARSAAHYLAVLRKRLDPEKAAIHVLRDSDLLPRDLLGDWPAMQMPDTLSEPLARNLRAGVRRDHEARRDALLAQGRLPEDFLAPPAEPEVPRDFDALADYLERMDVQARETQERLSAELARVRAEQPAQDAAEPADLVTVMRAVPDLQDAPQAPGARPPVAPPRDSAHSAHSGQGAEDTAFAEDAAGALSPLMHQGLLYSAHLVAGAPRATSFRSGKWRRRLEAADPAKRDFRHLNLSGVDLSGLDLRGADFRGAILSDADLDNASLDGCNFGEAVLARASMKRTRLKGATLDRANLGGARLEHSELEGASLRESLCQGTQFIGCNMRGAQLALTQLHEAVLTGCDLRASRWAQLSLRKLVLRQLVLDEAQLEQVLFLECRLEAVSCTAARLTRCGFVTTVVAPDCDLSRVELDGCSVSLHSSLAGVSAREASFRQCGLRGTSLAAANLEGARMHNCDLSTCDLSDARLNGLVGGESLFVRANFRRACLRGANLIDANLSKADLTGCDLRGANLFRADVSQARLDATTLLDGAYVQHAKVWPRLDPETSA